jgi:hypothetical protein
MKEGTKAEVSSSIWWLSKLSAMLLCLAAAILCHYAGDKPATLAFLALLASAAVVVAILAARRKTSAPATQ